MAVQRQDGWANDSAPTATGHDLRGKEYRFLTRTSAGHVRLAQNGEHICGVCQEGKNAGCWSSFAIAGFPLKVIASQAFTVGAAVQAGADGSAIVGTTNQIGVARNACASGEMVEVMVDRIT